MNITRRLFTYPVLSEEKYDYESSVFDVDFSHTMADVTSLKLNFKITMTDTDIQRLMNKGNVEFVVHVECKNTSFRKSESFISYSYEMNIPIASINGKIEILMLIICKKDIKDFYCADWVEDFDGLTFQINKGAIIGYKNLPSLEVLKNFEELNSTDSIFKVVKRLTDQDGPIQLDIDQHQIRLSLNIKEFDNYSRFNGNPKYQPILNAMLVFPALVYVFEELKQENGIETFENRGWFISLQKAYKKRNIDFIKEIEDEEKTSFELAQQAMELPIKIALEKMVEFDADDKED